MVSSPTWRVSWWWRRQCHTTTWDCLADDGKLRNELAGSLEFGGRDRRRRAFARVELEDRARVEIKGGHDEHIAVVVVDPDLGGARRRATFLRLVLAVVNREHLVPNPAEPLAHPIVFHHRFGDARSETLEELGQLAR